MNGGEKGASAPIDPAPRATLVIFGATGNLTARLLIPSILNLRTDGRLADDFRIIGIGRDPGGDDLLRHRLDATIAREGAGAWCGLRDRVCYLSGDFTNDTVYETLAAHLTGNVAFYLATAPEFFGEIADRLGDAGLLVEGNGYRRLIVEKPFGRDLASARDLNRRLLARANESQIYRIDHFLGKETVRNIMVTRFANVLLEAVWNNRFIDHVQITAAEKVSVGTRGKFYDATGAMRDMVPNHLFQLLAMVAMEPPNGFDADAVRDEKARVLRAVRGPRSDEVDLNAVRGRYRAAYGDMEADYLSEADVASGSRTETFAALKLGIDNWRWAGVPFYLRTGKALSARDTEIVVTFKHVPFSMFRDTDVSAIAPNRLTIQVQPDEGMSFELQFKRPGEAVDVTSSSLDFRYGDHFGITGRTGYETLLYDVLIGDQTLFQRADMIEAGWAAVQPILEHWSAQGTPEDYLTGSSGPMSADAMMARDGRAWHELGRRG
ncbi:glucose-6-phosphate dehydrogenase [Sphingomonas glacialis]|uniref:Glucose-6-phosphate 1-dehydrogenase n=1 Tax=Sphingomonas glacialis TaxID=658225 RepID=A0A502FR90_9SPHN|nr:glucose-6-phosphate dehydrogenase [Sphingomonas glacialis]TPG52077.1 glucose-6-phosphate dehydrogenase [Sphingomonas glacialis]